MEAGGEAAGVAVFWGFCGVSDGGDRGFGAGEFGGLFGDEFFFGRD